MKKLRLHCWNDTNELAHLILLRLFKGAMCEIVHCSVSDPLPASVTQNVSVWWAGNETLKHCTFRDWPHTVDRGRKNVSLQAQAFKRWSGVLSICVKRNLPHCVHVKEEVSCRLQYHLPRKCFLMSHFFFWPDKPFGLFPFKFNLYWCGLFFSDFSFLSNYCKMHFMLWTKPFCLHATETSLLFPPPFC